MPVLLGAPSTWSNTVKGKELRAATLHRNTVDSETSVFSAEKVIQLFSMSFQISSITSTPLFCNETRDAFNWQAVAANALTVFSGNAAVDDAPAAYKHCATALLM